MLKLHFKQSMRKTKFSQLKQYTNQGWRRDVKHNTLPITIINTKKKTTSVNVLQTNESTKHTTTWKMGME